MQPKPGAARIDDAAWCYPEPTAGRENLKDHVTFATGKGISISEPSSCAAPAPAPAPAARAGGAKRRGELPRKAASTGGGGGGGGGGSGRGHDSQAQRSHRPTAPGSSPIPAAALPTASPPPVGSASLSFSFAEHSARFLELANGGSTVVCHTNCGRPAQGTAFLQPVFSAGHRYRLTIRVDCKPGRMCYFIGVRVCMRACA